MFNLKVVSENVPDATSTEALLADIIKPGMTDEEKATAIWRVVYHSRFWNPSSRGNLRLDFGGIDPILRMNCFSPSICQQDAENCIALWELAGLAGRMWQLGWHTTPEVWYDGAWRHFDPTVGRITKDRNGKIASVTLDRSRGGGRTWMRPNSYISTTEGICLGHRMEFTLRREETFTRYWRPLGKDPDYWCASSDGKRPDNRERRGRRRLAKAMEVTERRFEPMPDDAAYGNGRWVFEPDLTRANWRQYLEYDENVAVTEGSSMYSYSSSQLQPVKPGKEALAVFRLRSPYVFSGGWVSGFFSVSKGADRLEVQASTDGGRSWRTLWRKKTTRAHNHTIGLRPVIGGKFDCLVRIRMFAAKDADDVRVGNLKFDTLVMNNPFMLPALKLGKTKITVAAGPQLDTLAIHPCMATAEYRDWIVDESNTISSLEADLPGWQAGLCCVKPGKESYVVFKVATPGELRRLRWGGRFFDDNETSKLFFSFDGKKWHEQPWTYEQRIKDTPNGRREHVSIYEVLDKFPKGAKCVWLKYWFLRPASAKEKHELLLTPGIRIDADYTPASRGKRPPVEVTYCWTQYEGGVATEKTRTKVIDKYPTDFSIVVKGDKEPTMNYVSVRLKPDAHAIAATQAASE